MIRERDKTDKIVEKITGEKPKIMRPPYGNISQNAKNVWNRPVILWSVDTLDWKNRNVQKNISITLRETKNGSIILFHDIHKTSVDSIGGVIKKLKAE